jgi:AmmeMemoRadiSam system protein A
MSTLLSVEDQRRVLREARCAVAETLAGRTPSPPPLDGVFALRAGVFVSLHRHGALRGCIGYTAADRPLSELVGRYAIAAATTDPRFPAVTAAEFGECDIEVSVLGPMEPVADPAAIVVGRHGLVVEQSWHRGLLLPQVATEYGWDRETLLAHTCLKAGLPRDAWKTGARLFLFEADVFGERSLETRRA